MALNSLLFYQVFVYISPKIVGGHNWDFAMFTPQLHGILVILLFILIAVRLLNLIKFSQTLFKTAKNISNHRFCQGNNDFKNENLENKINT